LGEALASYGFKLIKIELRHGLRHARVDFGNAKYLDRVLGDVNAAKKRREEALRVIEEAEQDAAAVGVVEPLKSFTQDATTGVVTIASAEDVVDGNEDSTTVQKASKRQSLVRFEDAKRLKQAVLLSIQYGVVGDHDKAVDPEGLKRDADLKKLATTRPYRVLIIAPPAGEYGFMAVEVISRSHAAGQMSRRLKQAALDHEFRIKPMGPVADEVAVKKLVEDGAVKEVQLFKTFIPGDSTTPGAEDVVLTFNIGEKKSQAALILQQAIKWLPKKKPSKTAAQEVNDDEAALDPSAEAHTLAAILWSDLADIDFDDVKVKVTGHKQKRTLQPLDHREGFIYDLGDVRVSDNEFCTEVHEAARVLFADFGMDMEADWYLPAGKD
jgi:hypothetical protein